VKREIEASSPGFGEISYVSETEYDSVIEFRQSLKDADILNDLRISIRKTIQDWLR